MKLYDIYMLYILNTLRNPIAGEAALDRLACALGGKIMLPQIVGNISQMLQHGEFAEVRFCVVACIWL